MKLWNALARLALHVRLPEHRNDHIPDYGDATQIRAKVEEVVAELEKLAEGNLSLSGIGETVSFECGVCDEVNKRRVALLRDGQSVHCFNPKCEASWKALKKGDGFVFQFEGVDFDCQGCGEAKRISTRFLFGMKYNQRATFECNACSHRNYVEWRLTQVAPETEAEPT